MKISATVMAIAGLCLVTACGPKGGGVAAGGGTGASKGAPASGPDRILNVSDLPRLKAGQWKQTLDDGDGKPTSITSCLSGKMPAMKMPKDCAKFTIKRTFLGAIVMDMNCGTPQFTMISHAVATGDFHNNMTSDMTMTITQPGAAAPRVTKMHVDAHYVGACAPGETPDDE